MCVLLSLFWPTFQSLIYELVDEDGCSSSFDISTRITQCAGFSSIRMYDDHDEVSHWVKSEESEDCKHVFFWIFLARRSWYILKVSEPVSCILGTGKKYRYRYRQNLVPEKSIGIGIVKIWYRKKVSVSVSSKFGTGKKYRYRYRRYLVPEKSIGIGIAQNYGYRHTLLGSKVRWENEAKAISLEEMYGNWQLRRLPHPSSNNCRLVIWVHTKLGAIRLG